jgi:hypothetical protein
MPYIDPNARDAWEVFLGPLAARLDDRHPVGALNYAVTRLVLSFLGARPNYARFNAVIGVLECAKLELYRRAVAPYEDKKIAENGDVYP